MGTHAIVDAFCVAVPQDGSCGAASYATAPAGGIFGDKDLAKRSLGDKRVWLAFRVASPALAISVGMLLAAELALCGTELVAATLEPNRAGRHRWWLLGGDYHVRTSPRPSSGVGFNPRSVHECGEV